MSINETRKAQLALRKFQDVAQLHLDILKERRDNIRKHQLAGDRRALAIEKSRADLIVKQLYEDVQQMFAWCSDLQDETWEWVQLQLRPLNTRIQSTLRDFFAECDAATNEMPSQSLQDEPKCNHVNGTKAQQVWLMDNEEESEIVENETQRNQKSLLLLETIEQRQQEADAHRQLLSDILELNEVMKEMDAIVRVQGETVDSIEENVDKALSHVQGGERNLFKAMKMKASQYPIAGAIIGAGAAAGPVGLLIGLKVAVVAAIGGSAIGAISGHMLRKKVIAEEANSHEMTPLSINRSQDSKSSRMKSD